MMIIADIYWEELETYFFSNMSARKIIIQIHYFLWNVHITNFIHRIDHSINSMNVNVSGVKFTVLKLNFFGRFPCKKNLSF